MKMLTGLILIFTSTLAYSSANIKQPTKMQNGFENVNNRMEYVYHGHESELIWHEFGRPFWKSKTTPKKEVMIQQTTTEKRASTLKAVSKNYDPVKRTLTLDVKFELNKSKIQGNHTAAIDMLGKALKEDKALKIEIQGHTDTTGSEKINTALSSKRAMAVKAYLMDNYEIEADRLVSNGYGPKIPVATNETREGREQNRRVDIKVLK